MASPRRLRLLVAATATVCACGAALASAWAGGEAGARHAITAPSAYALQPWTAATDNLEVTSYVVYRDGALLTTLPRSARTFNDTGLDQTTAHQYFVTARDDAGHEGPPSNVVARTFGDNAAPSAPEPQHRSSTTGSGGASETATSTRNSVRCRSSVKPGPSG